MLEAALFVIRPDRVTSVEKATNWACPEVSNCCSSALSCDINSTCSHWL